jgi:hypothetical protein
MTWRLTGNNPTVSSAAHASHRPGAAAFET